MPRELSFLALVIKKQPLGEADEIITLLSRGEGKVRAVSKSSKLATSKLSHALQPLFLIDVAIAGKSSLPKLIQANAKESFANLKLHPERVNIWFVVAELIIKLLPDHQPNEELYDDVLKFLNFLNENIVLTEEQLEQSLLKFKLAAMNATGLAVHTIGELESNKPLLFSSSKGGFYYDASGRGASADSIIVKPEIWQGFHELESSEYRSMPVFGPWVSELSKLVTSFISYQLEREIKAEKYL